MSWAQAKLRDVATIERDGIASDAIIAGTNYLGLEHIESGGKILGAATVDAGDLASTKFRFTKHHVLYGKLRPYLAKIATPDFDGICSTDIVPIMPGPKLDRSFLTHFLRQPAMIEFANSRTTGANLPRLSPKALADFEIPLPPLAEQKRIAAILDQADELRRKRQRAIDRLNQLGQAIFHEMFGGDVNYPTASLKALGKVSTGSTPPTSDASSFGGKVPFITPGDLGSGEDVKRTLTDSGAAKSRLVAAGATFVCCIGATIGKIGQATEQSAFNQQINAVEWSDQIDPTFGFFAIQQIRDVIIHKGKGASTTLPILKKSEFEKLEVIVPPLNEQRQFATQIKQVRKNQVGMLDHSGTLEALFTSLQHRAFRGEL